MACMTSRMHLEAPLSPPSSRASSTAPPCDLKRAAQESWVALPSLKAAVSSVTSRDASAPDLQGPPQAWNLLRLSSSLSPDLIERIVTGLKGEVAWRPSGTWS